MPKKELKTLLDELEWTMIAKTIKEANQRAGFFQDDFRDQWIREQLVSMVEKSIEATEREFIEDDRSTSRWVAHYTSSVKWFYDELIKCGDGKDRFLRAYNVRGGGDIYEGRMLRSWIDPYGKWLADPPRDAFVLSAVDLENAKNRTENILDDSLLWDAYGGRGKGLCFKIKLDSIHAKKVIYSSNMEGDENTIAAPDYFSRCLAKGLATLRELYETERENLKDSLAWAELTEKIQEMLARHAYRYKIGSYIRENEIRFIHPGTKSNRGLDIGETQPDIVFDEKGRIKSARNFRSHVDLQFRKLFQSGSKIIIGPQVIDGEAMRENLRIVVKRAGLPVSVNVSKMRT